MDQGVSQTIAPVIGADTVFVKTEVGRIELRSRGMALSPRLRSLLVMVDGHQTVKMMLDKLHGMGVDEGSLAELQRLGLIERQQAHSTVPLQAAAAASPPPEHATEVALSAKSPELLRLLDVRNFYHRMIRETIGTRGFMLQIDVENATTLEECRALRDRFLNAARKTADPAVVQLLEKELDRLLGDAARN